MKRISLLTMAALATAAPSLLAEDKNVTVSETIIPEPVYFNTPTPSSAVDANTSVKHSITINNGSSKYDINTVTPAPDSPSDIGSWKLKTSSTSSMVWKITALKNTALAYDINGGLTEILKGTGLFGWGPPLKKVADHKDFTVKVPAETLLRWNNIKGSHEKSSANNRLTIAAGEEIDLFILNSHLGNPVWTATGGYFSIDGQPPNNTLENEPRAMWTAPPTKGSYTVTATFPGNGTIAGGTSRTANSASITFKVIGPSSETVEKYTTSNKTHGTDSLGFDTIGVIMHLNYTLQPQSVNYYKTKVAEDNKSDDGMPRDAAGYYLTEASNHDPAGGKPPMWTFPDSTGSWIDKAGVKASGESPLQDENGPFWESGSFHWNIPVHYIGNDKRLEINKSPEDAFLAQITRNQGDGSEFCKRIQTFTLESTPSPGRIGQQPISLTLKINKTASGGTPAEDSNTIQL